MDGLSPWDGAKRRALRDQLRNEAIHLADAVGLVPRGPLNLTVEELQVIVAQLKAGDKPPAFKKHVVRSNDWKHLRKANQRQIISLFEWSNRVGEAFDPVAAKDWTYAKAQQEMHRLKRLWFRMQDERADYS